MPGSDGGSVARRLRELRVVLFPELGDAREHGRRGGIAQHAVINPSFSRAIELGITPFVPLDAVKAIIAAAIATPWKVSSRA
jgi:hypothetical protein